MAAEAGLSAIALTDHDILSGLGEAHRAADHQGIELVPGIELSLDWAGMVSDAEVRGGMHMLVLWVDDTHGPLQDRLEDLRSGRNERNHTILERLAHLGIDVPMEDVAARAGDGSVGRPHIAGVMVDRGYVPDIATAFDMYLGQNKPAYVSRRRLAPAEGIELALASGGVPILAHPHTLGYEDDSQLEDMLARLADLGLIGVESHHSGSEPGRRRLLRRMADRVGLSPSGGSDFHGTYKPEVSIGSGIGDLDVPGDFLEELRSRRMARR